MKAWFIPAPAPCARVITAFISEGRISSAETAPMLSDTGIEKFLVVVIG
jgi:hypothetical protein